MFAKIIQTIAAGGLVVALAGPFAIADEDDGNDIPPAPSPLPPADTPPAPNPPLPPGHPGSPQAR